jgi:putative DNA primase/helicase
VQHSAAPPLPDAIEEGERDVLLTSLAGSMRRRGSSPEAILAALRTENEMKVQPPLSDKQLRKIANSIGKKKPSTKKIHLTDEGNAQRFISTHRDNIRSVRIESRHPWNIWAGTQWKQDEGSADAYECALEIVREMHQEAETLSDERQRDELSKHATQSESASKIHDMLTLASKKRSMRRSSNHFDANPWLFNVRNGTVNLKTGVLQNHQRADFITNISSVQYDENARCPRWKQFLDEILKGDDDVIAFIQRAIGYSMTGSIVDHCLFFCYGQGRNGKSTFIEVMRSMFGDYAAQTNFTSLQSSNNDGPRGDIARLRGKRFVSAVEAKERQLDETLIKQLTGGDTVTARKLYESEFEFKPQFKLWLAANHKPVVKEQTEAFWTRIRLIPFTVRIAQAQQKKNLAHTLTKELSGILNWAIQGCADWREQGLATPAVIRKATKEYREEHDLLGAFIVGKCKLLPGAWTSTFALYEAFRDWWVDAYGSRFGMPTANSFGRLLSERSDIRSHKQGNSRGWNGIAVANIQGS